MDEKRTENIVRITTMIQTFLERDLKVRAEDAKVISVAESIVDTMRGEYYHQGLLDAARLVEKKSADIVEQLKSFDLYGN
ncbi:Protein of unknown function DUF2164 [Burkholderia sp. lig30]|jgi:uncharacterized protein (DUF2164 family)|uniref:DUF2164 family protein n=1 Tax=Burkholderia sp. lig30 TaxID=1192124 RepID=UPI000461FA4A|nr:DUF2164 family protein [Burkholderia sp. lig30]KDB10227.1 Protein of unknown function DUF2164 [Burkholderia sp. lig30]